MPFNSMPSTGAEPLASASSTGDVVRTPASAAGGPASPVSGDVPSSTGVEPIRELMTSPERTVVPGVRTEPIQERSAARVDALLDAAAEVVDEVGFDRLTTALVAERAQASIGTVYRYFPDRIALLQGLRDRTVQRFRHAVALHLQAIEPPTWQEAVSLTLGVLAELYRTERGFRIMRFVDSERNPVETRAAEEDRDFFARTAATIFAQQYGLPDGDDLAFRLMVATEAGDALIGRAFADGGEPDERFIAEARTVVLTYLASFYG